MSITLGNPADCWNWWCTCTTALRQNLCQNVLSIVGIGYGLIWSVINDLGVKSLRSCLALSIMWVLEGSHGEGNPWCFWDFRGIFEKCRVRFRAVKVPILVGSDLGTQLTKQSPQSSCNFVRVRFRGFQVRLRRLSEYGSVAYFVERLTWETQAEQYLGTGLLS